MQIILNKLGNLRGRFASFIKNITGDINIQGRSIKDVNVIK